MTDEKEKQCLNPLCRKVIWGDSYAKKKGWTYCDSDCLEEGKRFNRRLEIINNVKRYDRVRSNSGNFHQTVFQNKHFPDTILTLD